MSLRPTGQSAVAFIRHRPSLTALLVGAAGLSMFAASPAGAQEAAPQPPKAQEANEVSTGEIIVTARRRDERLLDAPVAITAVTGDNLDQYAVTDFTDIATLVPTMVAGRAASGSSASIFLRGVGSTALSAGFDQSVSFIIDGVPMSRGREIAFSQYDVSRVEVLKGPQALFYGKNTTGGLISVVTNGPGETYEGGFKVGHGFEGDEWYQEGFVSGPITESLRGRLAFRHSDSEGAFENTAAPVFNDPLGMPRYRTSEKRGGGETSSGRLTLVYEPNSTFNVELKVGGTEQLDGGPTDVLERLCGSGRTTPASANAIPPSPRADCRIDGRSDSSSLPSEVARNWRYARDGNVYADVFSTYGILTGNLSLPSFDIQSISSYYTFKQQDLNNVAGEAYPASFTQLAKFTQIAQELRFSTDFDGPFNLMFGVFGSDAEFIFNTDAYIFPVPIDPVRDTYVTFGRDDGFDNKAYSVFAEGTFDVTDSVELSAGARWSREERDSYQQSYARHIAFAGAFPGGIRLDDNFSDENVSPQATIRWKPSADVSVYASYKEGFKAGGFNISQALTPAATVAAGEYDSETAKGFEAGLRGLFLDRSLSLSVTAYSYLYEDLQVQVFDPVTVSLTADNAGELKTQGIEADFTFEPAALDGFSIHGAAAYNKAEYDNYIGQCYGGQTIAQGCNQVLVGGVYQSQVFSGRTPPKAPEFAGRLGAAYEFPIFGTLRASLSGDVSYTSEYNFTDTLRPDAVQEAYTKVDATARLLGPGDKWTLSLIGRNLTEEYVVTSANDIPFTGGTGTGTAVGVTADMSAFVENPREVYLELALKF